MGKLILKTTLKDLFVGKRLLHKSNTIYTIIYLYKAKSDIWLVLSSDIGKFTENFKLKFVLDMHKKGDMIWEL